MQVAAHGHRHTEDVLHIAQSLEAVHKEEKHAPYSHKPTTQARFISNGSDDSTDTELFQEILSHWL